MHMIVHARVHMYAHYICQYECVVGGVPPDLHGGRLQVWFDYGSCGTGGPARPRLRHSYDH